jgi:hypothetical protein
VRKHLFILTYLIFGLFSYSNGQTKVSGNDTSTNKIIKIEMRLSAFGVKSDDFPTIDVFINFPKDSSHCVKSFYNPAYEGSSYILTKTEMNSILKLLKIQNLEKHKREYSVDFSNQPRSQTIIYTTKKRYIIDDYGLKGSYPLQELYKIVYKL